MGEPMKARLARVAVVTLGLAALPVLLGVSVVAILAGGTVAVARAWWRP
jgi:hypothetical protein